MKRKMSSTLAVFAMVAASLVVSVTPAQASFSRCNGGGGFGYTFYKVRCFGNPGTSPNLYQAWVRCAFNTYETGPWRAVDISEPEWSEAQCVHGFVEARGYNTV